MAIESEWLNLAWLDLQWNFHKYVLDLTAPDLITKKAIKFVITLSKFFAKVNFLAIGSTVPVLKNFIFIWQKTSQKIFAKLHHDNSSSLKLSGVNLPTHSL